MLDLALESGVDQALALLLFGFLVRSTSDRDLICNELGNAHSVSLNYLDTEDAPDRLRSGLAGIVEDLLGLI